MPFAEARPIAPMSAPRSDLRSRLNRRCVPLCYLILFCASQNSVCTGIVARAARKEDGMLFPRRQLLRTLSFAFGSSFMWNRNQLGIAAQTAVQPKVSPPPAGAAVRDGIAGGTEMEKVTGIGGFF